MKKASLEQFINRYNLGGEVESVKITSSDSPMNVQITLDDDFTSKFIKSKGALSESDTFTFECKNNNGEIILGYSSINTNRISMKVDCTCDGDVSPISFSAKYLKEILNANRGSKSANLQISSQGLAHIEFEKDNLTSKYYLVEIK